MIHAKRPFEAYSGTLRPGSRSIEDRAPGLDICPTNPALPQAQRVLALSSKVSSESAVLFFHSVQSELNGWLNRLELELAALLNARVLGRETLVCSRDLFTANNRMLCRPFGGAVVASHGKA